VPNDYHLNQCQCGIVGSANSASSVRELMQNSVQTHASKATIGVVVKTKRPEQRLQASVIQHLQWRQSEHAY
jgi:hypothetical protein